MDDNLHRQMQEAFRENDRLVAEDDAFQRRYQNYLKQRQRWRAAYLQDRASGATAATANDFCRDGQKNRSRTASI